MPVVRFLSNPQSSPKGIPNASPTVTKRPWKVRIVGDAVDDLEDPLRELCPTPRLWNLVLSQLTRVVS